MKNERDMMTDEEFSTMAFQKLSATEPSPSLARLIAEIPLRHPQKEAFSWWPFGKIWQPSVALAFTAAMGIWTGYANGGQLNSQETQSLASTLAVEAHTDADSSNADPLALVAEKESEEDAELEQLFASALATDWQLDEWQLDEDDDWPTDEPEEMMP